MYTVSSKWFMLGIWHSISQFRKSDLFSYGKIWISITCLSDFFKQLFPKNNPI